MQSVSKRCRHKCPLILFIRLPCSFNNFQALIKIYDNTMGILKLWDRFSFFYFIYLYIYLAERSSALFEKTFTTNDSKKMEQTHSDNNKSRPPKILWTVCNRTKRKTPKAVKWNEIIIISLYCSCILLYSSFFCTKDLEWSRQHLSSYLIVISLTLQKKKWSKIAIALAVQK